MEIKEEPPELIFEPNDMEPISTGAKSQLASRSAFDHKIKVGADVQASVYAPHFADLRIVSMERKRLKYYDEEDAKREGYTSLPEFKRAWKKRRGEFDDNELVHVIRFQKVP